MGLTEIEKNQAIALVKTGFTHEKVAGMFKTNKSLITRIIKEYKKQQETVITPENEYAKSKIDSLPTKMDQIGAIKEKFGAQCTHVMARITNNITDDDIKRASLKDKAISFGIFTDKLALFAGMSTQNVSIQHSLVDKIRLSQQAE